MAKKRMLLLLLSVVLVLSAIGCGTDSSTGSGEEITLSETDFIYNEEYGRYEIMVEFTKPLTHVVIQMQANPYHIGLEELGEYLGNARKTFEETVYQP